MDRFREWRHLVAVAPIIRVRHCSIACSEHVLDARAASALVGDWDPVTRFVAAMGFGKRLIHGVVFTPNTLSVAIVLFFLYKIPSLTFLYICHISAFLKRRGTFNLVK